MSVMLRIRTIIAIGPLLGCTPLPPAPTFTPADVSSSKDALASDLPDAPPPSAARLTGAFVSSGSSSARLSGGFVWHGGSSRLSGWLQ